MMNIDTVMPFLWLKDETAEELAQELQAMYEMGIRSVVVESRVHQDFCGERWFREMDQIMDFARNHQMQVWLLDDKSYPTGYANGSLKARGVEKSWRVKALRADLVGPMTHMRVRISLNSQYDEELLGVYLAKRTSNYNTLEQVQDITGQVYGEYVYLDVPAGYYSVLQVIKTTGHYEREGYIDMLNPASVQVLVDTIYEPHYQRYKDDFGTTFMGFFSDEPRLNCAAYHPCAMSCAYDGKIGRFGIAYPWSEQLQQQMGASWDLLALWFDIGCGTASIRCRYMELVTDCYAKNFVSYLGEWCRVRGVFYTGHIIEDMDTHTSLCCSAGHYFKAMQGADLASVDIVLHQIRAFENEGAHMASLCSGYADADFFNYTLLKLASSDAHLDERKQGRALCEVFGAYGWGETTGEMLYQVNHCLVRGINYFIPHAFTSEFDNKDCPPHFYAGGLNPANIGYGRLFEYMHKMSEMFTGGKAAIDVAVLYHAQGEWAGGEFDCCDVVTKELMQNQIDFDIVDFASIEKAKVKTEGIYIGENRYKLLVIPFFTRLPDQYQRLLRRMGGHTLYAPKSGIGVGSLVKERLGYQYESIPNLRVMRYNKDNANHTMFLNEGNSAIRVVPQNYCPEFACGVYANNYVTGTYRIVPKEGIVLQPLEAIVCQDVSVGERQPASLKEIKPSATIYLRKYNEEKFRYYKKTENFCFDISNYDEQPGFSGTVRIVPHIDWKDVKTVEILYNAEHCTLYIGKKAYTSIGGRLRHNLENAEKDVPIYLELGCSLVNTLRDRFTGCSGISPCMLTSIKIG